MTIHGKVATAWFIDEHAAFMRATTIADDDVLEEKVAIPPPPLEPAPRNRAERRKRWHDMRRRR